MALPAGYVGLLPILQEAARECGYSLGLHGSLRNDMDLIAMPWVEEAVPAAQLIKAMHDKITYLHVDLMMDDYTETRDHTAGDGSEFKGRIQGPGEPRPHGRLSWNIHIGGGCKIDISVMPLKPKT